MKNQERSLGYIVFLSFVAAIGGILFGYDTAVISGTTEIVKAQFGLSTGLEGWFVGCALIGSIIGVMVAGMLSDFLGRKKTMLIAALMFSVSAIGCAVCGNFSQLVVYRMIPSSPPSTFPRWLPLRSGERSCPCTSSSSPSASCWPT